MATPRGSKKQRQEFFLPVAPTTQQPTPTFYPVVLPMRPTNSVKRVLSILGVG